MIALTVFVSVPIAFVSMLLAAFLFMWAYNLMFAAHMHQEEKHMMRYHYGSFLVTLAALAFVMLGVLIV